MARRVSGKVSRLGSREFGFIESDYLNKAAWFHFRMLRDPDNLPDVGDAVEFDAFVLPDGRIQAHDVAPAGSGPPPAMRPSEPPVHHEVLRAKIQLPAGLVEKLLQGIDAEPVAEPEAAPLPQPAEDIEEAEPAVPPRTGSVGERAQAVLGERKQGRAEVEAEAERLEEDCRLAEGRIAEVRAEAERRIAEIRAERSEKELRAEQLRAQAADMTIRPEERRAAWSTALRERCEAVANALVERASTLGDRAAARRSVLAALGEEKISKYEEVRRRLRTEKDPLAAEAYKLQEQSLRRDIARYADALDAAEKGGDVAIPVVVATSQSGTVAAIPLTDADIGTDPCWRVAAAFSHAMERAARDIQEGSRSLPSYGMVNGCLALRLDGKIDAELFDMLLGETWVDRPTLEQVDVAFEVEAAPSLAFEEQDDEEDREGDDDVSPDDHTLPAVTARLGLTLSETVGALVAHGLPFPDDEVDEGVEASLRSLLGLDEVYTEPEETDEEPDEAAVDRSSPAAIASRVLDKLLRDGRVGGRHTAIEHAYGHHFADEEKKTAKKVVDRLLVMGILRKKLNEGQFHVYIDPRRLREVWAIINMEWKDEGVFG